MDMKTKVTAESGKQEILISREFDLPLDLLFKAFTDPRIVEQWMGTKVVRLECSKYGSYQYETIDPRGMKYGFNGVIHEFIPDQKIVRTFEMEGMPFGVQLEVLEFSKLTGSSSKLNKKVIYESVGQRDENLKLPFKQGINGAHNRLEEIMCQMK